MKLTTEKRRLVREAITLKKAWLLTGACIGGQLAPNEIRIPEYHKSTKKELRAHVPLLQEDFQESFRPLANLRTKKSFARAASWMANQFDRWVSSNGLVTLCTAQYFEANIGELTQRRNLDIPPYCELLVQGLHGLAFRHPEYMLARDLEFAYSLYTDCEALLSDAERRKATHEWLGYAGENRQALARTVILTCFNLMDAFVSGLARGHLMMNPPIDKKAESKLQDNRRPLKNRLVLVPSLIAGKDCGLDVNKPPMKMLFGPIRQQRDSFVHCEPGTQESQSGYIKEAAFHDLPIGLPDETIRLTSEVICHIWQFLYQKPRPSWWILNKAENLKPNLRLAVHLEDELSA